MICIMIIHNTIIMTIVIRIIMLNILIMLNIYSFYIELLIIIIIKYKNKNWIDFNNEL